MTVKHLIQRLKKAEPHARVYIEAEPDSNEWTGVRTVCVTSHQPDEDGDLVDTRSRRINKGSVLLEATGPPKEDFS
jgi:hypothetical protein